MDDAVINVPGNVSITHALNAVDTVASLNLSDAFTLSGGTLAVMGNLSSTSTFELSLGGTLSQANVQAGTVLTNSRGGVVDRLTLAGTFHVIADEGSTRNR